MEGDGYEAADGGSNAGGGLRQQSPGASGAMAGAGAGQVARPGGGLSKRKRRLADLTQEEINEIVALRGKLPQAVVGKRFGIEQTDVSQIQRLQRAKLLRADDNKKRAREVELVVPIAYGSAAFWLGKKADEYNSHKWTAYVRAANNEDLGSVVKKVVFQLHPSFKNPTRIIEHAPFELNESGWGEFEMGITIVFHGDASERPVELFHHLRLYPQDDAGQTQVSMKKPVIAEAYDEIVFSEPNIAFYERIKNAPLVQVQGSQTALAAADALAREESDGKEIRKEGDVKGDTKAHTLTQWFLQFSDEEELSSLASARQQIAALADKLESEYQTLEEECQKLRATAQAGDRHPLL